MVEGVIAHLDRLGFKKARLRGLRKADCEGSVAPLAHDLKKVVARLPADQSGQPAVMA